MSRPYQLGWFSTGRDKAARDLLKAVQGNILSGKIRAEIAFVFSNREPGESRESDRFFRMVEYYHIPLVCLSHRRFGQGKSDWRRDYDRTVMAKLEDYKPDLCVLAGYMLIVGAEMCQRYNMVNLHPAAPAGPAGTWQEVIWKLIESGATETGVMMHLVTPELDKGPPVTFCAFPIRGGPFDRHWAEIKGQEIENIKSREGENNPLFKLIREHGLARELPLIVATIKAFAEGRVRITPDKRVIDAEGKSIKGYNMTGEIDRIVKGLKS